MKGSAKNGQKPLKNLILYVNIKLTAIFNPTSGKIKKSKNKKFKI